jgi:hypothetical protein
MPLALYDVVGLVDVVADLLGNELFLDDAGAARLSTSYSWM